MYRNRAGWSAAMLQRAKADLFGFQKLWHRDALVRVLEAAKLADDYALIAPDDHRGHRTKLCRSRAAQHTGWRARMDHGLSADFPPAKQRG